MPSWLFAVPCYFDIKNLQSVNSSLSSKTKKTRKCYLHYNNDTTV